MLMIFVSFFQRQTDWTGALCYPIAEWKWKRKLKIDNTKIITIFVIACNLCVFQWEWMENEKLA